MKIEWNKVTWYSKVVALILYGGTFLFAYWLGGFKVCPQQNSVVISTPDVVQEEIIVVNKK